MAKSIFKLDPKHPDAPKVFVSYSCDSKEHEQWVKDLTSNLRSHGGVNAITYLHVLTEQPSLDAIMIQGFEEADKVIIVGTAQYVQRAKVVSTGVAFESQLAVIVQREKCNKLVLIKRDNCDFKEAFGFSLRDIYVTDFSKNDEYVDKMEELVKRVWNHPLEEFTPIGDKPNFTAQDKPLCECNTLEQICNNCNIVSSSLLCSNITKDTLILWPVVPRPKLTIIHFAQLELLERLANMGCFIRIIIADCGCETSNTHRDAANFKILLENVLSKRNIVNYAIELLSKYFGTDSPDPREILKKFIELSEGLSVGDLMGFNQKDGFYDKKAQLKVQKQSTLKMMSTVFMWTACLYEASFYDNKDAGAVIVSGYDENKQWSHIFDHYQGAGLHIGALYIQTLTQPNFKSVYQPDIWNGFNSKEELEEKFGKGNIDWWVTQYFLKLRMAPQPISFVPFCSKVRSCRTQDCDSCLFNENTVVFPRFINKKKIAEEVFKRINPAQ